MFVLKFGQEANPDCFINYVHKNTPCGTPGKAEMTGKWLGVLVPTQTPSSKRPQITG
jgi:hypothetical protein